MIMYHFNYLNWQWTIVTAAYHYDILL